MLLEASAGQGTIGADLDKLLPANPGLPPTSYLLAGWVSAAGSPAHCWRCERWAPMTGDTHHQWCFRFLCSPSTSTTQYDSRRLRQRSRSH